MWSTAALRSTGLPLVARAPLTRPCSSTTAVTVTVPLMRLARATGGYSRGGWLTRTGGMMSGAPKS